LPCTPESRTAIRFVTDFAAGLAADLAEDFEAGFFVDFRGETAVFVVVAADLGTGFLVATI
jgi:hypothetical protein